MSMKSLVFLRDITMLILVSVLVYYGNQTLFIILYALVFLIMSVRALIIQSRKRIKTYFIISYAAVMTVQIVFTMLVIFGEHSTWHGYYFCKLIGAVTLYVPYLIERFMTINRYVSFYLPSIQELSVVSFAEIKANADALKGMLNGINKAGKTSGSIKEIAVDLPRHSSFRYISNGTLTSEYFERAYASLEDPHLYVVLSNTGSAGSELISLVTGKSYTHASLSFDYGLETIISYNGGERMYPPGLNSEALEFFHKKRDASIIVYRLKAEREQKQRIIDKVQEINTEGSAYNLMGLVLKYSHKPNIMFCSQFVYKMLKYGGVQYFEKQDERVQPIDLVEKDYYRKLEYAYEIRFND